MALKGGGGQFRVHVHWKCEGKVSEEKKKKVALKMAVVFDFGSVYSGNMKGRFQKREQKKVTLKKGAALDLGSM